MVELHGGHLVSHERTAEVNEALLELIRASESEIDPLEWTNLPQPSPGKNHKLNMNVFFPLWFLFRMFIC